MISGLRVTTAIRMWGLLTAAALSIAAT